MTIAAAQRSGDVAPDRTFSALGDPMRRGTIELLCDEPRRGATWRGSSRSRRPGSAATCARRGPALFGGAVSRGDTSIRAKRSG